MAAVQRRQVQREQQRVQAQWLVESGLSRAVARLRDAADYRGETWTIPAEELTGQGGAEVRIRVSPPDEEQQGHKVLVEAVYPRKAAVFARRSKEILIPIAPQPPAGDADASTTGEGA
jgi:hypothetical protein